MSDLISLRCSGLPTAFLCPGSVRRGELSIDSYHQASDNGTATHEILEGLPRAGSVEWSAIPEVAAKYHADESEVRMLTAMGVRIWPHIEQWFSGAMTEVPLSSVVGDVTLTGHADMVRVHGTSAHGGDWKTGRKDTDYREQMLGYNTLLLLDDSSLTDATSTIIWVRTSEVESYTMTRDQLGEWLARLESTVVNWNGTYHPGEHCQYCRRSHECPAANALARRDVAALIDAEPGDISAQLASMEPDAIVGLLAKASRVESLAKRVRDAVKAHVIAHGDIVADGKCVTMVDEPRRKLDPLAAWDVLRDAGFTDDDMAAIISMSVTDAEKLAAKKAGRGKGAAAIRELQTALDNAGAVSTTITRKLATKRA